MRGFVTQPDAMKPVEKAETLPARVPAPGTAQQCHPEVRLGFQLLPEEGEWDLTSNIPAFPGATLGTGFYLTCVVQ